MSCALFRSTTIASGKFNKPNLLSDKVFVSKGCDVRVLKKSPGDYYTKEEIEQVKYPDFITIHY